jgi:hypothetical protein
VPEIKYQIPNTQIPRRRKPMAGRQKNIKFTNSKYQRNLMGCVRMLSFIGFGYLKFGISFGVWNLRIWYLSHV